MDQKHLEELAIWIANNLSPENEEAMPKIFSDYIQDYLWDETKLTMNKG